MAESRESLEVLQGECGRLRRRWIEAAVRDLPRSRLMALARNLGLPAGDELTQVPEGDLAFLLDLAAYDAQPGRARPIDRLGRQRRPLGLAGLTLRALECAWCSVFRPLEPHPEAGRVATDLLLGGEVWILDPGLDALVAEGTELVVGRLGRVHGFAISTGALGPLDPAVLAQLEQALTASGLSAGELLDDPRFAALLYRGVLGLMEEDARGGS